MPAFYLLILLMMVLLWLSISCLYRPVGKFVSRLFGNAIQVMRQEDEETDANIRAEQSAISSEEIAINEETVDEQSENKGV